jgi:antitoxin HicB
MRFCYPVELTDDGDGSAAAHGVLVTFPDLAEANTFGCDRRDALASAVDCLEEALAGRICGRAPIPEPSPARGRPTVAPGGLIAAKTALYLALRASGLPQAELARRMGVRPTTVQRLLDPRHASKPEQFDAAFAALGKRLVVSVETAA